VRRSTLPDDDEGLAAWIRSHHKHYWHPGGSSRMGPARDPSSVVGPDGRVLGVEGLRVADASIFPEIPCGTPALPTVVVGEHMAARLLAVD
jgi:choline dehydrogenase